MDLKASIQDIFGIRSNYIRVVSEDQALCLVHKSWLKFLQKGLCVPSELHDKNSLDENLLNFYLSTSYSPGFLWKLLIIYHWKKCHGDVHRFPKSHEKSSSNVSQLSYSQLIHYVTKTNYRNLWEQAWRIYHGSNIPKKMRPKQSCSDGFREILKRLYKCQKCQNNDKYIIYSAPTCYSISEKMSEFDALFHPNLIQVLCAAEDNNSIFLIYEMNSYTLQDCLKFSPSILGESTIQPLFVVYQLLQIFRSIHNLGLFIGSINLSNIQVKDNMWIQIEPLLHKDLLNEAQKSVSENHLLSSSLLDNKVDCISDTKSRKEPMGSYIKTNNENTDKLSHDLSSVIQGWVEGNVSNFDYLMFLNKLAGRQKDNPRCHPVMPWIMDFSVPDGGWRDLSKSKFRLNKGDKQLDLIYESACEAASIITNANPANILQDSAITVPHHTSEVLTDITYYVYKARRTPKSLLCQHVRHKWVPAEYPSTIERLQEWTPDECIPEFYSEPTIFYSIHPDLYDLGVPRWADNPEEFIKKHRAALEGHYVSERLHHWIDLTFGYKLTGPAAVKSKNVCLPLVDQHTSIRRFGMVQLFFHPHPHKSSKLFFSRSIAPKTIRNIISKAHDAKDSGDDETSSESSGKPGFLRGLRSKSSVSSSETSRSDSRIENQIIMLPKDFNPLASLSQIELLCTFLSVVKGGKVAAEKNNENHKFSEMLTCHYQVKDMLVLGCLIGEMTIAPYTKCSSPNVSLEDRYSTILNLLQIHKQDIPRYSQKLIQLLLQLSSDYKQCNNNTASLPSRYPPVSKSGLPLPSPHQLLLPHIHTIPFPSYFPTLYSFLLKLNNYSAYLNAVLLDDDSNETEILKLIANASEKKISYAAKQLGVLLPLLNAEGIEFLTPYLQEMFENEYTALLSTWHLFGMVSQALGPQQTCKKLLKLLTKVFDTEKPSKKHVKLYHRTFLLQLIVRLGLQNFLTHFTTVLIEAIGGCKDYLPSNTESEFSEQKSSPVITKFEKASDEALPTVAVSINECDSLQDTLQNNQQSQPEVDNNEEDNDIFDLDINEEVIKERNNLCEGQSEKCLVKDKPKSDDETEMGFSSPSRSIYSGNELKVESFILSSAEFINESDDTIYSKSAPNLTSPIAQKSLFGKSGNNINSEVKTDVATVKSDSVKASCSGERYQGCNVSDVSGESMLWLAHRLGPVLTARYLTRNLLRMLTLCYDSSEKRDVIYLPHGSKETSMLSISCKWLKGDLNALKVLDCLSRIASLYGEQFIIIQYLKHIADLLNSCKKRISATLESGLHGAMALFQHIIPYLSDVTLMDHLQDIIIKDILYLVLRLICSLRLVYPGGEKSRTMVTLRMLDVLYIISLRLGFEMTRKHLSIVLQKFFSCFDKIYNQNGEWKELQGVLGASSTGNNPQKEQALKEMKHTFTPEMAFLAYVPFCKLAGGIHMELTLKNDELIRHLCQQHDQNMLLNSPNNLSDCNKEANSSSNTQMGHQRDHSLGHDESFVSGVFGKNVSVVGNRLDVHLGDESHLVSAMGEPFSTSSLVGSIKTTQVPKYDINLIKRKMDNCQRHLKGNWLAYWEHETGRSEKDNHFDFKQIKLQTFIGHTSTVRTVHVLDNENSFLTSSKDKTVKLWSLRSCGDGSSQIPCQMTYTQHRKSVFAVSFLDSLRLVGSCDSTVHIWDPFLGSCIRQLESTKGSPVTVLTAMPTPSVTFLAATTNSTVKFLDARTCRYMHEFKVSIGTTGLIRCLAVSPNGHWLAVGHSTGMLSVLDVRTGLLLGTWLGHEGEVLQVKAFNNSYFVTSSLDHTLSVWKFEDTQAKCNLKGPLEPVTSLCFYGSEVISGTTGNRIGLHSSIDKKATYSSTRLRSDTFKGMLTTMALLPLNRLLLLGTDNGSIVLLS